MYIYIKKKQASMMDVHLHEDNFDIANNNKIELRFFDVQRLKPLILFIKSGKNVFLSSLPFTCLV